MARKKERLGYKKIPIRKYNKNIWDLLRRRIKYSFITRLERLRGKDSSKFYFSRYIQDLMEQELQKNKIPKQREKVSTTSIYINSKTWKKFKRYCRQNNKEVSRFIEELIERDLNKNNKITT